MKNQLVLILLFFGSSLVAQNKIKLSDIWLQYKFYAQSTSQFNWMNDSTYYSSLSEGIVVKSAVDGKARILVDRSKLADSLHIEEVFYTDGAKNVIFTANSESLYRRSKKVYVLVYNLEQGAITVSTKDKVYNPSVSDDKTKLAYTRENNLYVLDIVSGEEKQLTNDGKWNEIINGRSDWVYEEEFGFTQAYHWIKGTNKIAYLKYDEAEVPTYDMQIWGNELYPTNYSYKYPKAGALNSKVSLHTIDVELLETKEVFSTDETFEYISKIGQTNKEGIFYFMRMNRLQNKLELCHYNTTDEIISIVYKEQADKYVELPAGPFYTNQGFIIDSYKSGYRHFHEIAEGQAKDLTPGKFDVKDFLFKDETNDCLYFTGLLKNSYTQSICMAKGKKVKQILKTDDWADASISPNGRFAIVTTSNLTKPYQSSLYALQDFKEINVLSSNPQIEAYVSSLELGKQEFFSVKSEDGHKISCMKILPPNFDKNKKYPVVMHCYGGPGHQVVTNQWGPFDFWYHQLLAQEGCIVVLADGRGTDGNGTAYRQASYGQFGNLEHKDQVTVANYFKNQDYVDSDKIGVWGWSYGGYLSSLCLMKSPEVFSTAIAVAPVTNWRFYDNVYTERYMGLPEYNSKGYDENSPTSYAQNLKGNYLLIHGTADDNVHIQNSIAMQNELLKFNKQFEMFYYPDKDHGIYGGYVRYNLYQKMFLFLQENLIGE